MLSPEPKLGREPIVADDAVDQRHGFPVPLLHPRPEPLGPLLEIVGIRKVAIFPADEQPDLSERPFFGKPPPIWNNSNARRETTISVDYSVRSAFTFRTYADVFSDPALADVEAKRIVVLVQRHQKIPQGVLVGRLGEAHFRRWKRHSESAGEMPST